MASREPEWFRPVSFCREVFHFSFRELGIIPPETSEHLNRYPEQFRTAVKIVGRAVFTLQVIMRNRLRQLFIESMNLIAGVVDGNINSLIDEFMSQGYIQKDIFNTTFSCFAVIAELFIFLDDFELPVPSYWYHIPWCAIYEHRLKRELACNGGWESLLERAKSRYTDSQLYMETRISFRSNSRVPHSEVRDRSNWPMNTFLFMRERFGIAPRSTTLAMRMLRQLYNRNQVIVPLPGAGAHAMREMLGLPPLEED